MSVSPDDLGRLIEPGLVSDIFRMERAYALLEAIGSCADVLNDRSVGNFGELFGAIQSALEVDCAMAAARIFDPPNKRYPTRSMRYVLDFVRAHKEELPAIREPYQLGVTLRAAGLDADLEPLVERGGSAFAAGVADRFLALINEPEKVKAIDALKTLRDKSLAHNEHVEGVEGPTWAALASLIEIPKRLVAILGWAYLGVAYEINGSFILSDDAVRASHALRRLTDKLRSGVAAAT
jgi:hypothetical protein